MGGPLPIRHEVAGLVWVRDAFHVVAFLEGTHAEVGPAVADALDRYQRGIAPESLGFILAGDGYKELTKRRASSMRARLAKPKVADDTILAKGGCGEDEVAAYGFQYWGTADVAGTQRTTVAFSYPTAWALERPLHEVKTAVLEVLGELPIISGYASLAIHEVSSPPEMIQALAEKHPGLDVHDLSMVAMHAGDGVRGAYWMTVLGPSVLKSLGMTRAKLLERLGPDIAVDPLGAGVAITAADELRPGDTETDPLSRTRRVAALIEPVRFVQTRGIFGFRDNDAAERFEAWHRRHLDGGAG